MNKEITRILVFLSIIALMLLHTYAFVIGGVFILLGFFRIIKYTMSNLVNDIVIWIYNVKKNKII